ncbi:hypothetical protein [Frigoribacterium sp. ACAM 257]|uniref:hypothetical protein n=1 Tax=Frigoribacterium sp. ACAM 257 TaxID=2508998 RepID=UPI00174DEF29|nr:hypothetical protein [Frigoribacterium sp. ACAM 257]
MSDGQHRGGGSEDESEGVRPTEADDDLELTVTRGRRARRAAEVPVVVSEVVPASSPPPAPTSSLPPAPASSKQPAPTSSLPPAPASSRPLAPSWTTAPGALTASRLGWEPGAPRLGEGGEAVEAAPKRPLGSEIGVLPELEHREEKKRPLWRHPAFIVSGVLAVLAVGVGATLMILSLTSAGPPQVTALTVAVGEGNVRLTWDGPDVPYDLYAVASDGAATDLTQLVRGTEAWIPRVGGLVTDDSCFVVRAAEATAGDPVSLEPADLGDQSAQSVCVADADAG